MSSSIGERVKITIFGQSHSEAVGVVIDGLPTGEKVDAAELARFMARRSARGELATPRREADLPEFISGLFEGATCGAPLVAIIKNENTRPGDYAEIADKPRPGHADFVAFTKYHGAHDPRGGGHFSGRLTAALCVAGGIAVQILGRRSIFVGAHIESIAGERDCCFDAATLTKEELLSPALSDFPVILQSAGEAMKRAILAAKADSDSVGGVVECAVIGLPAGLGSPIFDGVENRIAKAIFGIPAVKGIEFGAGFGSALLRGSQNNDPFYMEDGAVRTKTNRQGGAAGGLTNGMPLVFRAAFKPTPTIGKEQQTVSLSGGCDCKLSAGGRHDPCVVPRAVPCVEAAAAITVLDMLEER